MPELVLSIVPIVLINLYPLYLPVSLRYTVLEMMIYFIEGFYLPADRGSVNCKNA
jgi:hypothetical protein